MEVRNLEQRVVIKLCAKLDDWAMEMYGRILKVYSGDSLSCAQVFHWYKEFKHGHESLKDKAWTGRPIEKQNNTNAHCVHTLRLTVWLLADKVQSTLGNSHLYKSYLSVIRTESWVPWKILHVQK